MEDLIIGIENDNGVLTKFYFDGFIIDGFFIVIDPKKVLKNRNNFNLSVQCTNTVSQLSTNISIQGNVGIITFYVDDENQSQYLIGNDLNLIELDRMAEAEITLEEIILIKEVYHNLKF
jgi:hypothetical protein